MAFYGCRGLERQLAGALDPKVDHAPVVARDMRLYDWMTQNQSRVGGTSMSLQEFIERNHEKLLLMTQQKAAKRNMDPRSSELEAKHGVHVFLKELCEALVAEAERDPAQRALADPPTGPSIARTAALHGHDLLGLGFSIDEVVHYYGDICQAVTELAVELDTPFIVAEFHTLNRCLDNAIASAVTTWTGDQETRALATEGERASKDERLSRLVSSSLKLSQLLREGKVAPGGSTGMVLKQNLEKMRALLEVSSA